MLDENNKSKRLNHTKQLNSNLRSQEEADIWYMFNMQHQTGMSSNRIKEATR